jgi:hypothetical protein
MDWLQARQVPSKKEAGNGAIQRNTVPSSSRSRSRASKRPDRSKQSAVCGLLQLLFSTEGRDNMFLPNINELLLDYTLPQPRRQYSSYSRKFNALFSLYLQCSEHFYITSGEI